LATPSSVTLTGWPGQLARVARGVDAGHRQVVERLWKALRDDVSLLRQFGEGGA
jgi:hypothetical protein